MNKKFVLIAGFVLYFTITLFGQEPSKEDQYNDLMNLSVEQLLDLNVNVKVVSNEGENLFNSPSTVTIITKKTIQDFNFQTISEAISTVSGMLVINTYMKKDIPTIRGILQDQYANKILLLINGVPTFNSITGEGILNRIDINDVEQIEILKGPASVLYGSNACEGAINIVLKNDISPEVESHAGFGNNIMQSGAQTSYVKDNLKFFVSGNSYSRLNENTKFTDENGYKGKYDNLSINRNFSLTGSYKDISLLFNTYNNQEGFLGVLSSFESGAGHPHLLSGYLANVGFDHNFSEKLRIVLKLESDINQRILSRNRIDTIRSDISAYRYSANIGGAYKLTHWLSFDFGGLFDYRKSKSYSNFIKDTRSVITENNLKNKDVLENSIYTQANISAGKFQSTAGIRYTYNSLFGSDFCPRLSVLYNLNSKNAIKAIYGESFRAPSLFELYFLNPDSTIFGNKMLKPEKMHSFELAYLKTFNNFFIQVLGYYGEQLNKIQRIGVSYNKDSVLVANQIASSDILKNIYANVNNFNSYGIETEIKYNNPKIIYLFLNYSFCTGSKADSVGKHYNFKYVPEHQVSAGVQKNVGKYFAVSALYHFWSKTEGPINQIVNQQSLDLNFSLTHEYHSFRFIHSLSLKNVFNNQLQFPDFVRRNINSIPWGDSFAIIYSMKLRLI